MDSKKFLIILVSSVLAVFLGAFVAFWAIFGNLQKNYHTSFFDRNMVTGVDDSFAQMDKMFEHQQKMLDRINKDFDDLMNNNQSHSGFMLLGNHGTGAENSASIKTEEQKDFYKITVNLKPFNKDGKNVDVKVKGNTVSISAKYQSKDKNEFNSSQFYQSLTLPSKLEAKDIKQEKHGDSLVITIPKKI